jgi:hypothetical protein
MTGYTPTHIGIPKNHADFERKSVVLFQELLGDPSVKRLGRSGQKQYGIDLLGYSPASTAALSAEICSLVSATLTFSTDAMRPSPLPRWSISYYFLPPSAIVRFQPESRRRKRFHF